MAICVEGKKFQHIDDAILFDFLRGGVGEMYRTIPILLELVDTLFSCILKIGIFFAKMIWKILKKVWNYLYPRVIRKIKDLYCRLRSRKIKAGYSKQENIIYLKEQRKVQENLNESAF